MPKEITHWIIAEKTYLALERSPLKDLINKNKALYYFGVISFDTGFYAGGGCKKELILTAENLHYSLEQGSFAALARISEWIKKSGDKRGWAFLCGCLSHVMADSAFHPLVYYLTGDPHDPDPELKKTANVEHRKLESRLDLFTRNLVSLDYKASVNELLDNLNNALLIDLMMSLYRDGSFEKSDINKAIINHGTYYWLFGSHILYLFFKGINFIINGALDLELSLFYPSPNPADIEYFKTPKYYTNPFTGEQRTETVIQTIERVTEQTADILNMLGRSMNIDAAINYFTSNPGPILA
ncbi:MAG: zinc dependent phospholipase C family protein [Candidatus Saccharibacteria bacterium]